MSAPAGSEQAAPFLATAFYLSGRLFAVDAAAVEEVVRLRRTTPVPHAPPYVTGVMNLRGKIVSVIDLGCKLGIHSAPPTEDSRVYIMRDAGELVGVLVDQAADVMELDCGRLEPPPANVRGGEAQYLRGIARAGDRLVSVLDAGLVLTADC
jgi:purine-binding chemotaxis protein CheW